MGVGVEMTIGTTVLWLIERKEDPAWLFVGVVSAVIAVIFDALSHLQNDRASMAKLDGLNSNYDEAEIGDGAGAEGMGISLHSVDLSSEAAVVATTDAAT